MTATTREQPMEQAQSALLDSQPMRRDIANREYVAVAQPCPTRRSKIVSWCVLAMMIGGATLGTFYACAARGAERTSDRAYAIYAFRSGALLREDRQNIIRITAPDQQPYSSKTECDIAINGVRVDRLMGGEAGWRLSCREQEK